ncbi:acetyltransferase [Petrimonas sulfuriphila]|jgi:sugar O-acyltransferase (sialic acid O-acetyltransferase NeuD family)|uniref:acetyltransferase n=1 Tax=Petrimonas sulfuriphila TaxID=285070 RepID=UPI003EB6BA4F
MGNVILVGGFCEIIELCEENSIKIVGIIDNISEKNYYGYPIICNDEAASHAFLQYKNTPIIITPDSPSIREKLFLKYSEIGFNFFSLIAKDSKISKSAIIGTGCVIQNGTNLSSNSVIGDFVKLNTNANVMHDVNIGNFTTIAPNSVILGKVKIGEKSYIGANSTILPYTNVGNSSIVGAGAVVTKDVYSNIVVVGNPAKKLKEHGSR